MKLKNLPILKAEDINENTIYRLRILGKHVIPDKITEYLYYLKTYNDGDKFLVNCKHEHDFTQRVPSILSKNEHLDFYDREFRPLSSYKLTDESAALMTPLFNYDDVREVANIGFKTTGDPDEYYLYPINKRFVIPYGEYGDYKRAYVSKKTQPTFNKQQAIAKQVRNYEYLLKNAKENLKKQKAIDAEYYNRYEQGLL